MRQITIKNKLLSNFQIKVTLFRDLLEYSNQVIQHVK